MMKVEKAIRHHLEYHNANSQKNTCRCVEFVLRKFDNQFGEKTLTSIPKKMFFPS